MSTHRHIVAGTPLPELDKATAVASAMPLYAWLSPSFPVGSFAFSHGVEWAVHAGDVRDTASTIAWIGTLLDQGSLRNDVILASCAWGAASANDEIAFRAVVELGIAIAGSRERHFEAAGQGNAFIAALRSAWMRPSLEWAIAAVSQRDVSYSVAVAIAAAGYDIPRLVMLEALSLSLVQNLVSATIRLSILGHTDGQRTIEALLPAARRLAHTANAAALDDLGGAAFRSDIAAIKHETQRTRLFRS